MRTAYCVLRTEIILVCCCCVSVGSDRVAGVREVRFPVFVSFLIDLTVLLQIIIKSSKR